jgi:hypothetical protein
VPPPRALLRAASVVLIGGIVLLAIAAAAGVGAAAGARNEAAGDALIAGWLVSMPLGGALLWAYLRANGRRLRAYERRHGFLPRARRTALPANDRRALFRLEYAPRRGRLCLMVARWDFDPAYGWRRVRVVEHVWVDAADPVAIGTERAWLAEVAEQLEERAEDARLARGRERALADELLAERRRERERDERLARALAGG